MRETKELTKFVNESNLPKTKSQFILENFQEYFDMASQYEGKAKELIVSDENQVEIMQEARQQRLELKEIRVDVEKKRKTLKEQIVREGKAIDGIANIIKAIIVPIEKHLETQEKYKEYKELERKEKINNQRLIELSKYVPDIEVYQLKEMPDKTFEILLETSKIAFNAQKQAEEKAIKEKEEKEKTERENQEKIRLENIKLKKEQEEREKQLIEERKQYEQERLIQEEKLKKEQEEREKTEEKIRIIKRHQEAKEKMEREDEIKEQKRIEDEKRKELLAPDKQKLLAFANLLDKIPIPNVSARETGKILDNTQDMLNKISQYIREQAKKL